MPTEQKVLIVPQVSQQVRQASDTQGEVGWLRRESSGVFGDRGVVVSLTRSGRTD